MLKRILTASGFLFFLGACKPVALDTIVLPDHQEITCDDYATHVIANGVLYNNVWNKGAADNAGYRQCLVMHSGNQSIRYGWWWDWPVSSKHIFAQPQIKIGSSPWDPNPKFGNDLPLRVSDISEINLAHELGVTSNGDFNVATTMWLTRWLTHQESPNRDSIAAELMIWTYYTPGQLRPGGSKVDTFMLDGLEWQLWQQLEWGDKSGVNQQQWRYIAFRLVEPKLKVEFDAHALIVKAVERGSIDSMWYVADLELGTELMGGQGLAWVDQFDVQIVR